MIREEKQKAIDAVERLNALKQFIGYDKDSEIVQATQKSIDMAIKALEQQPSEDCISRQAVLDCFKKWQPYMATRLLDFEKELSELPPVTPQPKTGYWIADVDRWGDIVTTVNGYRCSECDNFNTDRDNYCPNCGCRMKGESE